MARNSHDLVRFVKKKGTDKFGAKCNCGQFHEVDYHGEMQTETSIPPDNVEELVYHNIKQSEQNPAEAISQ